MKKNMKAINKNASKKSSNKKTTTKSPKNELVQ